jgi:hypothetical protein
MMMKIKNLLIIAGFVLVLFGCQTKSVVMPGQEVISESNPAGETNPVVVPVEKPVEKK